MSKFSPIDLKWAGTMYSIAPDRIMGAIGVIEDHLTLVELYEALARQRPPLSKISQAYAAVINYAARDNVATAEQVYEGMFGGPDLMPDRQIIELSIATLLAMMQPPEALKIRGENSKSSGKAAAVAKPSKSPSKQRSAQKDGVSRRGTSGRSTR